MAEPTLEVYQVAFEEGGISVTYMEVPTDVRVGGRVAKQHQIRISAAHPDYREDIEGLYRKVQRVLTNVLEDFEDSEPHVPVPDDEDDDMRGMGDPR